MQSLFNVMSVASFVMSAGMMIGTVTIYSRIPALTKRYVSELKLELAEMITDMVPGQIDEVMPELPTTTGPSVPIKSPF
jgi:F0F1-type ATP synthase membrane subunit a